MNAVGLGHAEEAHELLRQTREVGPELSLAPARRNLGAMSPEVDQRISAALGQAGLE